MCVWVCECVSLQDRHFLHVLSPTFPSSSSFLERRWHIGTAGGPPPPPSLHLFLLLDSWNILIWFDIFFLSREKEGERERERERERRKKEMEGKKEGIGLFRSGRFAPSVTDTFKCDDPTTIYWPLPNSQWQKFLLSKAADAPAASPGGSSQFNWWWWWSKKKFEARETRHHEANPRQTRP